jgi:iron complex transport system ATP-binding protein
MKVALVARDLGHSYGRRPVLDSVTFSVHEGEFLIIIGPNGSGKTTLVKALAGAFKPRKGEIEILGRSMQGTSRKVLARNVAVVPQTPPADVPFTAAEVVLMGRSPHLGLLEVEKREDLELAERAMLFTNVQHLAGRRLDQLSAGERQRVLIARAICQQPHIIVLDEPTAPLDLAHQIQVMDLLERLRNEEGVTIIMVSHDLNLAAMYADRLLLLKEGSIISLGRPDEVLTFQTLEQAYGCVLLVDENPVKKVPRVTLVPGGILQSGFQSLTRK